ncbi:hypothetical protein AURDEDRAFT_128751 [Auricularia subglabra TFB-10046 SS5]|nr:hypothetical protein AURDEDRAFT_128751 [Auricularia subglabra TFB-10046 SS5]
MSQRGRPRIHEDDKARKKAYYWRNVVQERERAKARWHAQRARLKRPGTSPLPKDPEDPRHSREKTPLAEYYCIHAVKQFLNADMGVDCNTNLELLLPALKKDLKTWRHDADTDDEYFRTFSKHAVSLLDKGRPASDIEADLLHPQAVVSQVYRVANDAADEAWKRDPGEAIADESLWKDFNRVAKEAQLLECALGEFACLYRDAPESLRSSFEDETMMWNYL